MDLTHAVLSFALLGALLTVTPRLDTLTNLLNPKVGAFYVAVLPQFNPSGQSPLLVGLLLALVHDVDGIIWFTAVIAGVRALRGRLLRRWLDGAPVRSCSASASSWA